MKDFFLHSLFLHSLFVMLLCAVAISGCQPEEQSTDSGSIWYEPEGETVADNGSGKTDSNPTQNPGSVNILNPNTPEQSPTTATNKKFGVGASLNGFRPFPDNDAWNLDISKAEVDANSDNILAYVGLDGHLHPDFGSGTWNGGIIGIPYIVVPGDQPRVTIEYQAHGGESDAGPFPIPFETPIEGDPGIEGDRHAIIVDIENKMLYELYRAFPKSGGAKWHADSGAIFNLKTNTKRPQGWTSADAAGLPIFPGLVRYDEVGEQKEIKHALRFTLARTRRAYVAPASHWASRDENPLLPPMGMRVRLKADIDLSNFPPESQVILRALKKYGMILADNGSDWFISGSPDKRWDDDVMRTLQKIKVSHLEIIKMEKIITPYTP